MKATHLRGLVNKVIMALPRPIQRWLVRMNAKEEVVPPEVLPGKYKDALTRLLAQRAGRPLGDYLEFGVYQATQAIGEDDFDFKCKVLSELVEHHVEEEEEDFFPKVEKALGEDSLNLLGEEMEEAFEEARGEDFRAPLYANLQEVFAGALKTTPAEEAEEKTGIKRSTPGSGKRKGRQSA
jgi:hypothetical protein